MPPPLPRLFDLCDLLTADWVTRLIPSVCRGPRVKWTTAQIGFWLAHILPNCNYPRLHWRHKKAVIERGGGTELISRAWEPWMAADRVGGARSAVTAQIPLTFANRIKVTTSSASEVAVNEVSACPVAKSHSPWRYKDIYISVSMSTLD